MPCRKTNRASVIEAKYRAAAGTLGNFCNFSACFLRGIGECPVLAKVKTKKNSTSDFKLVKREYAVFKAIERKIQSNNSTAGAAAD
jgi:hypothetical protein